MREVHAEGGFVVEADQHLAFSEQEEAGLKEMLNRIFAPWSANPDAVVIEPGPAIELGPRTIMSLGLVLHELATNAAKYGALSAADGQVGVGWKLEDDGQLRISWVESGGPPVNPPAAIGYGSQLISSTITYSLRGRLEQEYAASGFRAEIVIPLGSASPLS